MRCLTLIASATLISATQLAAQTQTSSLPLPKHLTCFDIALTANKFIALGEEGAVKELERLCETTKENRDPFYEWELSKQVSTICRVIFKPKEGAPMRGPYLGLAMNIPHQNMKPEDWPLFPLAESDGVYFLLADGYSLNGVAETARQYLDYCRSAGVFRTTPVIIPTEETARRALDNLIASAAWKKLKWRDSQWFAGGGGWSYDIKESNAIAYLEKQTKKPKAQPE